MHNILKIIITLITKNVYNYFSLDNFNLDYNVTQHYMN